MKNKLLSILLTMVLTTAFIPFHTAGAFAASTPKISISDAQAKPGDTIDLTVSIEGNPGITSLDFSVKYDTSQFELTGKRNGNLLGGSINSQNFGIVPYYCGWINSLQTQNCVDNGELITLTFKVKKDAVNGKQPFSFTENEVTAYDVNLKAVKFAVQNGYIEISNGKEPAEPDKPSSGNGNGGGLISLPNPSDPAEAGSDNNTAIDTSNPSQTENSNADDVQKLTAAQKKIIAAVKSMKVAYKSARYDKTKKSVVLKYEKSNRKYKLDGYQIYRSTKKTSGFKKVGTTSKTTWTDSKISSRKTSYYYRVRGFRKIAGKTYYTGWSVKKKVTVK